MTPTRRQWAVLLALWNGAQTARDVADAVAAEYGWAYATVKTMLDRLVRQGLVASDKRDGVNVYRAAVTRESLQRSLWREFVDTAFGGAADAAVQFVSGPGLDDAERAALERELEALDD